MSADRPETADSAGPATHRFLAQRVRVIEITQDGCRVIFEDGCVGKEFYPRSELVSMAAIEADQDQTTELQGRIEALKENNRLVNGALLAEVKRLRAALEQCASMAQEAVSRVEQFRAGILAYLNGDYENPRRHRPGECAHGINYYEPCKQCIDAHFTKLLDDPS